MLHDLTSFTDLRRGVDFPVYLTFACCEDSLVTSKSFLYGETETRSLLSLVIIEHFYYFI